VRVMGALTIRPFRLGRRAIFPVVRMCRRETVKALTRICYNLREGIG
jgi:hypothetical protein